VRSARPFLSSRPERCGAPRSGGISPGVAGAGVLRPPAGGGEKNSVPKSPKSRSAICTALWSSRAAGS